MSDSLGADKLLCNVGFSVGSRQNLNCKHEFLNHITEQITTYTYPSCHQVYDVAKAIIQKFPYLCEKIGSGYDGWYICIKDKLKNVRRHIL
jgi:hypothetical protein